jgi:hypothetical protein
MFKQWIKNSLGFSNGTTNYIQKLDADKNLVDSIIKEENGKVSIGEEIISNVYTENTKASINNDSKIYSLYIENQNENLGQAVGVVVNSSKVGNGDNAGGALFASGANVNTGLVIEAYRQETESNERNIGTQINSQGATISNIGLLASGISDAKSQSNIGISGKAEGDSLKNIGLVSRASGADVNFCFKGTDGSEGVGKFLKSVTAVGEANWANISANDIDGIRYENNYSLGSWDGNSLLVNHNLNIISPIVFCYVDNKLAEFDILTIDENNLSINKTDNSVTPTSIKVSVS